MGNQVSNERTEWLAVSTGSSESTRVPISIPALSKCPVFRNRLGYSRTVGRTFSVTIDCDATTRNVVTVEGLEDFVNCLEASVVSVDALSPSSLELVYLLSRACKIPELYEEVTLKILSCLDLRPEFVARVLKELESPRLLLATVPIRLQCDPQTDTSLSLNNSMFWTHVYKQDNYSDALVVAKLDKILYTPEPVWYSTSLTEKFIRDAHSAPATEIEKTAMKFRSCLDSLETKSGDESVIVATPIGNVHYIEPYQPRYYTDLAPGSLVEFEKMKTIDVLALATEIRAGSVPRRGGDQKPVAIVYPRSTTN